jgi:hypothetical protein
MLAPKNPNNNLIKPGYFTRMVEAQKVWEKYCEEKRDPFSGKTVDELLTEYALKEISGYKNC